MPANSRMPPRLYDHPGNFSCNQIILTIFSTILYKKTPVEQFVNYCPTAANSSAAILVGPASWKIHRLFSLYCRLICSAKSIVSLYHSAVHFASYFLWHFSLHFRGWCQTVTTFLLQITLKRIFMIQIDIKSDIQYDSDHC